jgi:hypothetical protein
LEALFIGLTVVTSSATVAAICSLVYRRLTRRNDDFFNDVAGSIFQVVGTLYAVLLGLIVVDTMNSMTEIRQTIEHEANGIANVFILSEGLPAKEGKELKLLSKNYVESVVDEEWAAMRNCSMSKKASATIVKMWDTALATDSPKQAHMDIRSKILDQLSEIGNDRRKRLLSSLQKVPTILWAVLIFGGISITIFTFFFGLSSASAQAAMAAIVAGSVSLNIYLVYLYGYPFSGSFALTPDGFITDRFVFNMREKRLLDKVDTTTTTINLHKVSDKSGHVDKLEK